ncbi:hypothetical protein ASG29_09260 [Sphingomonas sp. Leaf412]|uniref:hypothetical protein n=1 Tax=Sphingomonas sp. Leaf412 TaxID=1736370 RepID=UPI0006FC9960|nr:hypothetical protein [Sphingomonas sp. Leaf412]KQT32033.1 hypothetical protein ASG29_09260 [Sphingomonas sp. Leaf412]
MPRLIDPGQGAAIGLEELVAALDEARFDPRDEDAFAAMGPWLARLGRNPGFLSDLAIAELERRFSGQSANAYGAQVLLLAHPDGRYALRANFWPARDDAVVRAGGTAPFFYDLPHDHNFSFLTVGYMGPGYWSDYYRFDGEPRLPGDAAGLVFEERARLEPGRVMLYRAHRDVHVQLPPDAFSVSLNILGHDRTQQWRSQYRFDIGRDVVAEALTVARSEALVTLAVALGGAAGAGLAAEMAVRHPAPRMRMTAIAALDDRRVLEKGCDDPDALVARAARARLAILSDPEASVRR